MDSIAADIAARTAEGHAAFSMRGTDDRWILIQTNTFTNWANEQLKPLDVEVTQELHTEFTDGIKLCQLMEVLQVNKQLLPLIHVLGLNVWIILLEVYIMGGGGDSGGGVGWLHRIIRVCLHVTSHYPCP